MFDKFKQGFNKSKDWVADKIPKKDKKDEEVYEEDSLEISSYSSNWAKHRINLTPVMKTKNERAQAKQRKKQSKPRWRRIVGRAFRVAISIFMVMLITGTIVVSSFAIYIFQHVDGSIDFDLHNLALPGTTIILYTDPETGEQRELHRLHGIENRIWVDFEDMSPYLELAYIAVEDRRWHDHTGVDWRRTVFAFANMFLNLSDMRQGGSTITQQLVKNITGDDDISSMRKIQEIMRARNLEQMYAKDTIMEAYLNTIHLGNGTNGVETAANFYFNIPASEITIAQAATLAALTRNPTRYCPLRNPEINQPRRDFVIWLMYEQELITREQYDEAIEESATLEFHGQRPQGASGPINSYFVDALIDQVIEDLMEQNGWALNHATHVLYAGGLTIHSTHNPVVQGAIDNVFENPANFARTRGEEQPQAAVVIMNYEGHVLGLMGSRNEKTANRVFNRATQATRQPGSSFKPLGVYAPLIDRNEITFSTMIEDREFVYRGHSFRNHDRVYRGNMTAAHALERSTNTVPARLLHDRLGVDASFSFLTNRLGFTTLVNADRALSPLSLGAQTYGVTVMEMTAAFAPFGNQGRYYRPMFYTRVYDGNGNVLLEQQRGVRALDPDSAFIMNEMLRTTIAGPAGTGGAANFGGWPIFGKTGTTDNMHDRWFVGGTSMFVGGVWFGFEVPRSLGGMSPNPALRIWRAIMVEIHEGHERTGFERPEAALYMRFCTVSGGVATSTCTSTRPGWFRADSVDQFACHVHRGTILPVLNPPDPLAPPAFGIIANTPEPEPDPVSEPTSAAPPVSAAPPASAAPPPPPSAAPPPSLPESVEPPPQSIEPPDPISPPTSLPTMPISGPPPQRP